MTSSNKLFIVGNPETVHIGRYFHEAGVELGYEVELCDLRNNIGSTTVHLAHVLDGVLDAKK